MQSEPGLAALKSGRIVTLRTAAGWLASLLILIWLAGAIDWTVTFQTLSTLRIEWVAVALIALSLHILARALRWRALFHPARPAVEPTLTAMLVGQSFNLWLPARMGDVLRVVWLSRRVRVRKSQAAGTLLVEKLSDALPLIGVLLIAGLSVDVPGALADPLRAAVLFGAFVCAVIILVSLSGGHLARLVLQARAGRARRSWWEPVLRGVLDGVAGVRSPVIVAQAAFWTIAAWTLGACANWLIFQSLALPAGWLAALLVSAAARIGVSVGAAPAAIGVYEGAVVVSLSLFSIPADAALGYALVMHAVDLLVPVTATAVLLTREASHGLERDA